jgi:hypothetical protein
MWAEEWDRDWRQAQRRVAAARGDIEQRLVGGWGLVLPDDIFRFWAFFEAIGPDMRADLEDHAICPGGIVDFFEASAAGRGGGIDPLTQGRGFYDPPEFVTFMTGDSDGFLSYGLWFDDVAGCDGVASYFSNTPDPIGRPGGTPLQALRKCLENRWAEPGDDEDGYEAPVRPMVDWVRERLMTVETGDRRETGDDYLTTYHGESAPVELLRKATLDGSGALVPARSKVSRPVAGTETDDWTDAWRAELTGPRDRVDALVRQAMQRCAADDPGHALVLGRDLHWITTVDGWADRAGDPSRWRDACDLLSAAYQAMGRRFHLSVIEAQRRYREQRIRGGS